MSLGITSPLAHVAALATVRVESPTFTPSAEKYNGDPRTYFARYDGRKDLGNTEPGDGFRFRGRGYIQITGRANYAHYSKRLGIDLIAHPDLALDRAAAAAIFAAFFFERRLAECADKADWVTLRRRVNGGLNGYADFRVWIDNLTGGKFGSFSTD